jgi:hypothetical protein
MAIRTNLSWVAPAAFAVVAACSSSSSPATPATSAAPATRVFIGAVEGSDARVGVVATDQSARIFFCGGDASYKAMTHWIPSAPIDGHGGVSLPADKAGWVIQGQVAAAAASGMVTVPGGSTFSFHADPVAKDTIAGLYEAMGPCGKVGLIVSQGTAGDSPAGQGACVPASGNADPEQVNPIRPIERGADGSIAVTVGGAQVLVHAAAPPERIP